MKAAPQYRQLSTLQWSNKSCSGIEVNPLLQVSIYQSLLDTAAGMDYLADSRPWLMSCGKDEVLMFLDAKQAFKLTITCRHPCVGS